jgi:hypothetical protein
MCAQPLLHSTHHNLPVTAQCLRTRLGVLIVSDRVSLCELLVGSCVGRVSADLVPDVLWERAIPLSPAGATLRLTG